MKEETIGWIGLGGMGSGMAALVAHHLHSSNHRLLVFNRTASKTQDFTNTHPGTAPASHPSELAATCHITFSCLANDEAVKSTFQAFISQRPPIEEQEEKIEENEERKEESVNFVDCSTVLPSTTRSLAALAEKHNVIYCHCPVFGRPDAAAAGKLMAYLAGGSDATRQAVAGLAGVTFAQNGVHDMGVSDASAASAMKLVGNAYIVGQIELAGECLALGEKAELPQTAVLGLLHYLVGNAPIPSGYARRMAAGDYHAEGGLTVDLGIKDVSHMQALSREVSCPLPVVDVAMGHLLSAKARHGGNLDWGAIGLAARDAAGLVSNVKE